MIQTNDCYNSELEIHEAFPHVAFVTFTLTDLLIGV